MKSAHYTSGGAKLWHRAALIAIAAAAVACEQNAAPANSSTTAATLAENGSADLPNSTVTGALTVAYPAADPTALGEATEILIDRTSHEAAKAAEVEGVAAVQRVREFRCDPKAVGSAAEVADVAGAMGATLGLRTASSDCKYHLVFTQGRGETRLSQHPGGYLMMAGGVAPYGNAVVCASNIHHIPDPAGKAAEGELPRLIERVDVECTYRGRDGRWSPMQTVVQGTQDHAAWVVELQQSESDPNAFRLIWMRDFSFQFLNLSNEGRPETDGVYATDFRVERDGQFVATAQTWMSPIIPRDAVTMLPWEPETREEYEALKEGTAP